MALDPNIVLGLNSVKVADPYEAQQKALTMRQMLQKTQMQDHELQSQQGLRDAYRKNIVTGPDGQKTVNMKGVIDSAMEVDPAKAMELQTTNAQNEFQQKQAQMKSFSDQIATAHELASSMADQQSYALARQKGIELGLPNADKLPEQYDPNYVEELYTRTMSTKEKFEQANNDRNFQTKIDENKIKHEENAIKREQMNSDKTNKMAQDLDKHLAQGWAGRSGQAGQVQGKMNAAEYAETLIDQGKHQPNGLDSRQIEELATNTAKLLGGTGAASARIEALVPHTAFGQVQSMKEWLTNNPQGTGQEEFVKRMAETVQREKAKATEQMQKFQIEGLPAHSEFKKRNPDLYNKMLEAKGIGPSMIDEKGRYKAPTQQGADAHPQDAQATAWAKANPDDPRSAAILKLNSGGQ